MSEDISILASSRRKHYGTVQSGAASRLKPYILYHVSPGDTLVSIAVKYGTTVQHLKMVNHLWTTDISTLECIKVPADSNAGDSDSRRVSQSIELTSVNTKSDAQRIPQGNQYISQQDQSVVVEEQEEISASDYLQSLFDHAHRAKQCASSVLQNSRLSEILLETGSNWGLQSQSHNSRTFEQPSVIVTSPSSSSLNAAWVSPSVVRPQTCVTPANWSDHYQL
ncbi:hypothetical protein FGIG_08400 [Fasciola gigantica]|uniref:LysM domain-containing protein n=1 Tax=Fasciola gigantica TaxID=46835 RepID=A0A504YWM2_FASGI|nr:hypothetical protein FGIG_08400 [Fasciola gigantica]